MTAPAGWAYVSRGGSTRRMSPRCSVQLAVNRHTKGTAMRDIAVEIVVEDDEIVTATEMVASH
ncbi:hypothetical protein UI24_05820 [Mycobacteroides franklinii]|nr:hypothetical protein [Mycobacteroides franklinii]